MDAPGFVEYLRGRGLDAETISRSIEVVGAFETWLSEARDGATAREVVAADASAFVLGLADRRELTPDDLLALARYTRFTRNHPAFMALLDLYGAPGVMESIAHRLGDLAGDDVREAVFAGLDIPPVGTRPAARSRFTCELVERLERCVNPDVCEQVLCANHHSIPRETFAADRERFLALGDVDEFIRDHHERFIRELEGLRDQGLFYFEQPVTDDVIEYVRATPTCTPGVREGSVVHYTKIPYQTHEYLHEHDAVRRRYLACHCPWVRESILDPAVTISSRFCQCSAGFEKQLWEAVLEEPVRAEPVRTVLDGAEVCEFAIHLPSRVVPGAGGQAAG